MSAPPRSSAISPHLAPFSRRVVSVLPVLAALAAVLALSACGGPLAEAKDDFKKGLYSEAKEDLVRAEADSHTWDDRHRAEYALYRGLTHGALGDRAAATLWLHEAKAIESTHPGTLSADDRARLNLALESTDPEQLPAPP